MSYISCAELARRAGISRQAVNSAINSGRISADIVRRNGSKVLVMAEQGLQQLGRRSAPATTAQPPQRPAEPPPADGVTDWPMAWGGATAAAAVPVDVSSALAAKDAEIEKLKERIQLLEAYEIEYCLAAVNFDNFMIAGAFDRQLWALPPDATVHKNVCMISDLLKHHKARQRLQWLIVETCLRYPKVKKAVNRSYYDPKCKEAKLGDDA